MDSKRQPSEQLKKHHLVTFPENLGVQKNLVVSYGSLWVAMGLDIPYDQLSHLYSWRFQQRSLTAWLPSINTNPLGKIMQKTHGFYGFPV